MSTPEQDQRLAEEIETYEAMGGEEQTVVWLKELQRHRKASQTAVWVEAVKTELGEYVVPTARIIEAGWDEPERFEWPAKVVHRFTTKSEKKVVQFLLKDKKEGGFVLKTWSERYLEVVKPEGV